MPIRYSLFWRRASLKSGRGTRIADLGQAMAFRETPIRPGLTQNLRLLDVLVDMGDRCSAALQITESIREVRLTPQV